MKRKLNGSTLNRRRLTAALACAALAVAVPVAMILAGGLNPPAASAPVRPDAPAESVETELVTITPTGFEPSEITRPRGKFLLAVNNRTGLEEINLRLGREAGNKLREVKLRGGKLRSGTFEDLPPGRYVLTEAGHPDWVCRITITPN